MDKSVSRCVLFVYVNFPSSIDVTFFVKQDNPRVVKSHLNNVLQQRSFMALLFLAQLGEKEERSQPKLFNAADKENCFLMTLQRKCCPHSASSSIRENKKKDLFWTPLFLSSYLLAGVSGAVAAGASAVLTLRMRISASLVGVARGVAVTRAAATLGVDIGRW